MLSRVEPACGFSMKGWRLRGVARWTCNSGVSANLDTGFDGITCLSKDSTRGALLMERGEMPGLRAPCASSAVRADGSDPDKPNV